jgi:hypothetical protein
MADSKTFHKGDRTIPKEPTETSPLLGSNHLSSSKDATTALVASQDDEEALLQNPRIAEDSPQSLDRGAVRRIILVLLVGRYTWITNYITLPLAIRGRADTLSKQRFSSSTLIIRWYWPPIQPLAPSLMLSLGRAGYSRASALPELRHKRCLPS